MVLGTVPVAPAPTWASYFDGHLAMMPSRSTWKVPFSEQRCRLSTTSESLSEGVGHDAGVGRDDHMTVVVHFEAILKGVALAGDVLRIPVNLERLVVPRLGLDHHLVHMLVILGALAERRVQQSPKRQGEHHARQSDLCGFVTHI